jgi:hypothetical protein
MSRRSSRAPSRTRTSRPRSTPPSTARLSTAGSKEGSRAVAARALKNAHEPAAIDAAEHRAIIDRGIERGLARRRGRVIRIGFGVSAVLAAAAILILLIGKIRKPEIEGSDVQLAVARTTQPLFTEPFPKQGGESQRIDRIAMARASDLRENRFARWGVK